MIIVILVLASTPLLHLLNFRGERLIGLREIVIFLLKRLTASLGFLLNYIYVSIKDITSGAQEGLDGLQHIGKVLGVCSDGGGHMIEWIGVVSVFD
jgi:hypothetical protein